VVVDMLGGSPAKLVCAQHCSLIGMRPAGKLDGDAFAQRLPEGAIGTAAIFTDHVSNVIRRVLLRQVTKLNYIQRLRARRGIP